MLNEDCDGKVKWDDDEHNAFRLLPDRRFYGEGLEVKRYAFYSCPSFHVVIGFLHVCNGWRYFTTVRDIS